MKTFIGPSQEQLDEGIELFEQNLEAAQGYMESGHWSAAIPFLHSAHQLASAQLEHEKSDLAGASYDFSTASVLLILAYKKLGLITEAFEIYACAIEAIEELPLTQQELKAECIENINFQFPDPQQSRYRPSNRLLAH